MLALLLVDKSDDREGKLGSDVSSNGDSCDETVDPSKAESRLFSRVFKPRRSVVGAVAGNAEVLGNSDAETDPFPEK